MADKKISELDLALQINNDAVFPFSQDNGGEPTSFKGLITQLGTKLAEDLTFSNLQTTSKTLVGAINELLSLGNPIILGTIAPSSSVGKNGNLYIQYTVGTGGADDTVDGIFVKINGAWCEIQTGGAGGHTIVDNSGTDLAQRTNLQFIGAYSEDNSADDTTEVNIVRSMTKAQFESLSAAEKVGLINITDESLNATELPIQSGSATNTKDYIDTGLSGKQDALTVTTGTCTRNTTNTTSANISYSKYGKIVTVGGYLFTKNTWSNTATPVFELPYKSAINLNPTAQTSIGGDNYKTTYLNVSNDLFNVRLDNSVENNQVLRFAFSYITND